MTVTEPHFERATVSMHAPHNTCATPRSTRSAHSAGTTTTAPQCAQSTTDHFTIHLLDTRPPSRHSRALHSSARCQRRAAPTPSEASGLTPQRRVRRSALVVQALAPTCARGERSEQRKTCERSERPSFVGVSENVESVRTPPHTSQPPRTRKRGAHPLGRRHPDVGGDGAR